MFSFGLECSVYTLPTDNLKMHTVTVVRDIQWLSPKWNGIWYNSCAILKPIH